MASRLGRGDAHGARQAAVSAERALLDGEGGLLHLLGGGADAFARVGEHEPVGGALEELCAELALEGGDPPPHRGVIDPQPARGARQGFRTRQLEEEAHRVPVRHAMQDCMACMHGGSPP